MFIILVRGGFDGGGVVGFVGGGLIEGVLVGDELE